MRIAGKVVIGAALLLLAVGAYHVVTLILAAKYIGEMMGQVS